MLTHYYVHRSVNINQAAGDLEDISRQEDVNSIAYWKEKEKGKEIEIEIEIPSLTNQDRFTR